MATPPEIDFGEVACYIQPRGNTTSAYLWTLSFSYLTKHWLVIQKPLKTKKMSKQKDGKKKSDKTAPAKTAKEKKAMKALKKLKKNGGEKLIT
ncbi:MAG: hypothetical protein RIC19_02585 [Phaeodactylibacter sp.]|uniref:hypothetical protein n=1 Tax=Phaeodactylibacter sp. TaxID=1940289 RepID=UPI0032EE6EBB